MSDFIRDTHRVARAESSIDHLLNMQFSDIENNQFHKSKIVKYQKLSSEGPCPPGPPTDLAGIG